MQAIAGAKDVTAGNALVALNQIENLAADQGAHAAGEADVSQQAADAGGAEQAHHHAGLLLATPFAGQQGDLYCFRAEGAQGALNKAFGTTERVVGLADDGQMHRRGAGGQGHGRVRSMAAST